MKLLKIFPLLIFITILAPEVLAKNSEAECSGVGKIIREKGQFVGYSSGGISGFFVRTIDGLSSYYDFNDELEGCAVEGVIKDSTQNEIKQSYHFQIEGEYLILSTAKTHDTFFVKDLSCNYLILHHIKNAAKIGDTLRFSRTSDSPFDLDNCYRICSTNEGSNNQNQGFGFWMIIGYTLSVLILAVYFGAIFLSIKYFFNARFFANMLIFVIPLSILFAAIEYATQLNMIENKSIYFLCFLEKETFFTFNFYNQDWTEDGGIPKSSLKYWFVVMLSYFPHIFAVSAWLSWRKKFFHHKRNARGNSPSTSGQGPTPEKMVFWKQVFLYIKLELLSAKENSYFKRRRKFVNGEEFDTMQEKSPLENELYTKKETTLNAQKVKRLIKANFSSVVVMIAILIVFLTPTALVLQAISLAFGVAPHNWLVLIASYLLFLYYFKNQIWVPFYKEDIFRGNQKRNR